MLSGVVHFLGVDSDELITYDVIHEWLDRSEKKVLARLPGADRVIPTHPSSVPPLCMEWVMLSCPLSREKCKRRHYYVSDAERDKMTQMRQSKVSCTLISLT